MREVLLDTDILSHLMRAHPTVLSHARRYTTHYNRFTFSIITRYEILRGLRAKSATAQEIRFHALCNRSHVLGLSDTIVDKAASIYADLHKRGEIIGDADILIAATAQVHRLPVCTNNGAHFDRIANTQTVNWLI